MSKVVPIRPETREAIKYIVGKDGVRSLPVTVTDPVYDPAEDLRVRRHCVAALNEIERRHREGRDARDMVLRIASRAVDINRDTRAYDISNIVESARLFGEAVRAFAKNMWSNR